VVCNPLNFYPPAFRAYKLRSRALWIRVGAACLMRQRKLKCVWVCAKADQRVFSNVAKTAYESYDRNNLASHSDVMDVANACNLRAFLGLNQPVGLWRFVTPFLYQAIHRRSIKRRRSRRFLGVSGVLSINRKGRGRKR
jgi:hypothetical protein